MYLFKLKYVPNATIFLVYIPTKGGNVLCCYWFSYQNWHPFVDFPVLNQQISCISNGHLASVPGSAEF